jgi:CheY-like chemotaxis protein
MAPETLARIFDPFFSTKGKGRGLGLSSVVGIVQTHGGGIAVRSAPGEGTAFRIVLPSLLVQAPAAAAAADDTLSVSLSSGVHQTSPADAASAPGKPGARRVILLAEDEADIRKVLVMSLRAVGFEVLAADNGREAVEIFAERSRDIHVVLLDQEMPVMNGEEAFRAIRALREDIPIVVMTGYGETSALRHFGHLMPNGVLGKPFTRDRLMEMIERACKAGQAG